MLDEYFVFQDHEINFNSTSTYIIIEIRRVAPGSSSIQIKFNFRTQKSRYPKNLIHTWMDTWMILADCTKKMLTVLKSCHKWINFIQTCKIIMVKK